MVEILQTRLPDGGQASVFNLNSWVLASDLVLMQIHCNRN
jgi:hypothetical protein